MSKYALRQKIIRRIRKFELTETEIDELIRIGDCQYNPSGTLSPGEPYNTIKLMIETFSERERYDLMCLMYLGRNIAYYGFNEEAVDDFCFHADEWGKRSWHGSTDPEYLAGKVQMAKWLRLAKENVRPDYWNSESVDGNETLKAEEVGVPL